MEITITLLVLLSTLALCFAAYVNHCYSYWKRRNVFYLKPTFPLGNNESIMPKGISIGIISKRFYSEFKKRGLRYGGVYSGLAPSLVIVDPVLSDVIMKSAFQHFTDRGIYMDRHHPITVNIFAQTGKEWKVARSKFTNAFTVAKMKNMFPMVRKCCEEMEKHVAEISKGDMDVDIGDIFARYTTDVIGSVIFGVSCNSFTHPDADFRRMGRRVFEESTLIHSLRLFVTIYFPRLANSLHLTNIEPSVAKFFTDLIKNTIEYREKEKGDYNDFMQILTDMLNAKQITVDEVIGQTFLLYLAGFGTSSNASNMALYQMSLDQDAQNRARKEILEVLKKHNNEITFESLNEMKYLNQIVEETLRIWPPLSTLTRVCENDYQLPGTDLTIEKGVTVLIPILAMHHDGDYWQDPEKWDPSRFDHEISKDVPFIPFGDGPRICLGARLGNIQVKLGLAKILMNYQVSLSPNTKLPLELDPDTFIVQTKQTLYYKLKRL